MSWSRVFLIVLDSVGIGELPDAAHYGDSGANTLGHIAEHIPGFHLPQLEKMGLGNISTLRGVKVIAQPIASWGKMAEVSVGKDTMTGHWELMGLRIDTPFRTFPNGFPQPLLDEIIKKTGRRIVCNQPASGTAVLDQFGEQQMKTGDWIIYTSADSVLQIAAHEDVIPLQELYDTCKYVRELTMNEQYLVGRVIARPYVGQPGSFIRTANRHDYALSPPQQTLLNALQEASYDTLSIGKIHDIFNGSGISSSSPTKNNAHGMDELLKATNKSFCGLCFANLVDFDSLYGHRRDVAGYGSALIEFDRRLPEFLDRLGNDDLLIITADHGNDPTHHGTDHTREYVPLFVYSKSLQNPQALGVRQSFADVAATIAELFGVNLATHGQSFLHYIGVINK
jgi:phosphopentomutase